MPTSITQTSQSSLDNMLTHYYNVIRGIIHTDISHRSLIFVFLIIIYLLK